MQLTVLYSLVHLGLDRVLANGIGYVLAAQTNFVLSAAFTWYDRKPRLAKHTRSLRATKARTWSARWVKFNATVLAAVAVNELVFANALHAGLGLPAAAAAGILISAVLTFSINHLITFRGSASSGDTEQRPHLDALPDDARANGAALSLPAFTQDRNLEQIVPQLVWPRTQLRRQRLQAEEEHEVITPWPANDGYLVWIVGIFAAVLSASAYFVTVKSHAVLLYVDTISHMEIARRVVDGTSPGLAQLGGVWLPLQHMLMTPFIWANALYRSGFAGSIVSMAAYVTTTVLTYKIASRLTGQPIAGVVAAAVFALNPNMLYMQSTPMTEPLLYCMAAAAIYCIQQWANTDRYQYLMAGAVFAFLGTLTRYETWPITACLLLAVVFIAWCRPPAGLDARLRRAGVRDRVTAFSVVAFAGILGWALWNWVLFGNPLNFQDGPYAKPSLWITAEDVGLHNWSLAAKTFIYAMKDVETWPLLVLALVGLVTFVAVEWRKPRTLGRSLPVLCLLIMIPFFIVSVYTGQRPLYVIPLYGKFYNVRFALIMLLPTAILVGYLIGALKRWRPAMIIAAGLAVVMTASLGYGLLYYHNVVTYNEVAPFNATGQTNLLRLQYERAAVQFVKSHYNGGRVLMQDFSNELIAFQLPSNELVYEGSYGQWQPALRNPSANHARWIIEWCGNQADQVCRTETSNQLAPYKLVYGNPHGANYRIYELRS